MTNNLDTQYQELLRTVLRDGTKKADRTGVGTISKFGHTMRFDMSEGFPLLTTKKIFTKAMLHELLWFVRGGDNIKYLVDNGVRIWNEWPHRNYNTANPDEQLTMAEFVEAIKADEDGFAAKWGDLGPVYGKQWIDWKGYKEGIQYGIRKSYTSTITDTEPGVNQLDQVIDLLKNNPDSRRIMVSAWNPSDLAKQLLPPCHYAWQVWSRELTSIEREDHYAKLNNYDEIERLGMHPNHTDEDVHIKMDELNVPKRALSLMFQMRSVDCFLGMPFDIASYAGLLTMIAHCTDMVPDELLVNSGDTHIYLNHLEQVDEQLKRTHFELPTLTFNPETKNIYEIKYEDFIINNYQCHPSIKADVAV
jgi:thymidylate synthase